MTEEEAKKSHLTYCAVVDLLQGADNKVICDVAQILSAKVIKALADMLGKSYAMVADDYIKDVNDLIEQLNNEEINDVHGV